MTSTNDNYGYQDSNTRFWYALYTRPRFERKVDFELRRKGLQPLVATRTVERIWSDRLKKIDEPLFPCYVFVNANPTERHLSLETAGVVRMVGFNGRPSRISEFEIQSIQRVMRYGFDPKPVEFLLSGDQVEVVSGPLSGLRGFFQEDRGKSRFVMTIPAIKQSISIEIDKRQIKKTGSKNPSYKKDNWRVS